MPVESPFDRVLFVCRAGGGYSVGVYLHGPAGGDPACLEFAKEAASSMRSGEADDSAAGLCGHLFKALGDDVANGGGLSLLDAPKARPDGSVDWQGYCSWNVDLILIDVDRGTAEGLVTLGGPESPDKSPVARLEGLKFGG